MEKFKEEIDQITTVVIKEVDSYVRPLIIRFKKAEEFVNNFKPGMAIPEFNEETYPVPDYDKILD